jgi:hypothetical protein
MPAGGAVVAAGVTGVEQANKIVAQKNSSARFCFQWIMFFLLFFG